MAPKPPEVQAGVERLGYNVRTATIRPRRVALLLGTLPTLYLLTPIATRAGELDLATGFEHSMPNLGNTYTWAIELGPRGVRVNAVCPGWVKTEMDVADQGAGGYTDADITGRVPMGRFASPDDVARAIAFLADAQESGYINGHALVVDGGWIADGSWETLRLRHR